MLTADIGGTNARFGLVAAGELRPRVVRVLPTAASPSPEAAAMQFLAELGKVEIDRAVIAWAGPIGPGILHLTNGPWSLDRTRFATALGVGGVRLVNDFEAVAHAIAHLGPDDLVQVGGGPADPRGVKVVMGPGTGLGTATVAPVGDNRWMVLPGEGGHSTPPLAAEAEFALWRHLFAGIEHPGAEHLLSGPGLVRTYRAVTAMRNLPAGFDTPAAVCRAAIAGEPAAAAAFELFLTWLGRMAGDLALFVKATGGVYIGGGIVPRYVEQLKSGPFRAAFEAKGPMTALLRSIPAYVITAEAPALIGCAAVGKADAAA